MFLKSLIIQKDCEIIREINFHKGVNFIVDETPESHTQQSTGNNVGKTTVLRLVDFCFGSDGKNIYQDIEFKKQPNTIVADFLKKNNIIISIVLVENLDDENSPELVIKRNFLTYKKKIQEVNNQSIIDNAEFDLYLKQRIFDTKVEKPTFRQIISKNIRDEKNRMTNIIKVLNPYTRPEEYEALFLFWLGLEFAEMSEKYRLSDEKRVEERMQKQFEKSTSSLSLVEQTLSVVNRKIEELYGKKNNFNINPDYKEDIDKLNDIKYRLNRISSELGKLGMRKDLIEESKEDLEKEYSRIDSLQIKLLYEKAHALIPAIQVSFESTLKFHNDLITEKLRYITKELPELEKTILTKKSEIGDLTKLEQEITERLHKAAVTEDLEKIVLELNQQYERKGKLEERKRFWEESKERLSTISETLNKINDDIYKQDNLIENRITEFNKFFIDMSEKLYDEDYLLSSQKNAKTYDFIVTNIEGNPSPGKKKGQISAFDFAYILFADSLDIKCLHFVMHDQLENIHDNQLNTLFKIANSINCQYIVPILRDKLPANIEVSKYEVLSLSQNDKLFKI
jgi:uncharacterized protein YydD (DUF2326 family)